MATLITTAEARDYLQASTSDDARITAILEGVSARIRSYCNQTFDLVSYTEFFDGGHEAIILSRTPIFESAPALVAVVTDTDADPDDDLDADEIIVYHDEGMIEKEDGGIFTFGRKRWKVVYSAGLSTVPDDVKLATKMWAASIFQNPNPDLVSESIGDYSYQLSQADDSAGWSMPVTARNILSPYRIQSV